MPRLIVRSREASGDSTGSTDTTLPAPTALLDWWNGAWYGWWKMTGCSGDYESMEGQWWDVCGCHRHRLGLYGHRHALGRGLHESRSPWFRVRSV